MSYNPNDPSCIVAPVPFVPRIPGPNLEACTVTDSAIDSPLPIANAQITRFVDGNPCEGTVTYYAGGATAPTNITYTCTSLPSTYPIEKCLFS